MRWPDPTPTLAPTLWAVVGAAATRLYMPERATADLDIAVRAEDGPEVRRRLEAAGWPYQGRLGVGRSMWRTGEGVSVDMLELDALWITQAITQAIAQAQDNRDAQGLPVLPLPYLVLMKFQAGRSIDIGDISRMLGLAAEEQLAAVRALFSELAPEDLEDLESLIRLGKLEMEAQ